MKFNSDEITSLVKKMLGTDEMKNFLATYNVFTSAILSLTTIAVIVMIVFHITKLAKAADNMQERKEAITGLAVCSVCFIILGSIDVVYMILLSLVIT